MLTETHRQAQVRLGAQTAALVADVWPLLDPDDLGGTFERWVRAVAPIIAAQHDISSRLAAAYLNAHRADTVGAPFPPVLAPPPDREAVTTSLLVTGPVSVKAAMTRGVDLARAMDVARASSSASAMRHSLDGGRETIRRTTAADPRASGFQRVTSGSACTYCSGLAGIQFATDDVFKSHDGCSCSAEPVYR